MSELSFSEARISDALDIARDYGQIEGDHHRAWVIDQMVRSLTGSGYRRWVEEYKAGEHGPNTYSWDEGVAP